MKQLLLLMVTECKKLTCAASPIANGMAKRGLLMILLAFMSLNVLTYAETGRITVSSGGKHTYFKSNQLQDAINAANANDTIYLQPGIYDGVEHTYTEVGSMGAPR